MLITAVCTPLGEDDQLDMKSFHRLLQHQKKGADGVVIAGTTGQGTLLTSSEKGQLLKAAQDYPFSRGFCVSDLNYDNVLKNIDLAAKFDTQFLLLTPLFFVRSTQEAIAEFFLEILNQSPCPVILYNNPSRVGVAIENSVYDALRGHKNLLGVKESGGKTDLKGIQIPVFCGDDDRIIDYKKQGAVGAISVLSNVFVETIQKALLFDPVSIEIVQILTKVFYRVNPLPIQYILKKNHLFATQKVKKQIGSLSKEEMEKIDHILEEAWGKLSLAF